MSFWNFGRNKLLQQKQALTNAHLVDEPKGSNRTLLMNFDEMKMVVLWHADDHHWTSKDAYKLLFADNKMRFACTEMMSQFLRDPPEYAIKDSRASSEVNVKGLPSHLRGATDEETVAAEVARRWKQVEWHDWPDTYTAPIIRAFEDYRNFRALHPQLWADI